MKQLLRSSRPQTGIFGFSEMSGHCCKAIPNKKSSLVLSMYTASLLYSHIIINIIIHLEACILQIKASLKKTNTC